MHSDRFVVTRVCHVLDLADRGIGAGLGPHEDPAGLVEATALRLLVDLLLLELELAGLDFKQASLLSRQFLLVGDLLFDGADFL